MRSLSISSGNQRNRTPTLARPIAFKASSNPVRFDFRRGRMKSRSPMRARLIALLSKQAWTLSSYSSIGWSPGRTPQQAPYQGFHSYTRNLCRMQLSGELRTRFSMLLTSHRFPSEPKSYLVNSPNFIRYGWIPLKGSK